MLINCYISISLTLEDRYRVKQEKFEGEELQRKGGGQRAYGSDTAPSLHRHKGRL